MYSLQLAFMVNLTEITRSQRQAKGRYDKFPTWTEVGYSACLPRIWQKITPGRWMKCSVTSNNTACDQITLPYICTHRQIQIVQLSNDDLKTRTMKVLQEEMSPSDAIQRSWLSSQLLLNTVRQVQHYGMIYQRSKELVKYLQTFDTQDITAFVPQQIF